MKIYNLVKWFLLYIVKPCVVVWVIVNGLPPTIRALFSGICSVIKLLR